MANQDTMSTMEALDQRHMGSNNLPNEGPDETAMLSAQSIIAMPNEGLAEYAHLVFNQETQQDLVKAAEAAFSAKNPTPEQQQLAKETRAKIANHFAQEWVQKAVVKKRQADESAR